MSLDRDGNLIGEAADLLKQVQKARELGGSQPQRVIKEYEALSKGETGPWGRTGFAGFMKAVRECPSGNNWHQHAELKAWDNHLRSKALPSGMNEMVGADGGFLVPPEFANTLLMRVYQNDLLSRTTTLPLENSNTIEIPAINETSRADGSRFGGVSASWSAEGATGSTTQGALQKVSLKLNALRLFIRATDELLQDAATLALGRYIDVVAPQELQFKIGDAIVNGDGAGKPNGLMNSPSKIAQAKESGQAAATINAANVLKMWSRLHVSCRPNAVWLCDQSIEPQLGQMTIGTAGANMVVYQPPGGLSGAPYATLMGKPLIPVEFCQTVGTEGDLILTDLSTYLTATKSGMMTASSIHVYFLSAEQVFRFIIRMDGRNWWTSALTPKSGGATQSNIVTLAVRS